MSARTHFLLSSANLAMLAEGCTRFDRDMHGPPSIAGLSGGDEDDPGLPMEPVGIPGPEDVHIHLDYE